MVENEHKNGCDDFFFTKLLMKNNAIYGIPYMKRKMKKTAKMHP